MSPVHQVLLGVHHGVAQGGGLLSVPQLLAKPLLASLIMGAVAILAYKLVSAVIPSQRIDCLLAIAVAGVVYLVLVVVLKIITADDCALLPKGEKIARILRIR